ncbi:uncharacterized protein BYT42DRAFT_502740 [Radiomyces spectabilis]|uniref:uncharacterized protein n=1 Tax=Radiomyces spectabilis TaxID=64574 RepID=UPI00221F2A09|nr:uncharacterized protein BYT42DRAFT_502740 [Radiomyces spectabilis]KAI8370483.1 hypothetical protein BYT42DRAFT_502740 [Radiomyces spectabilis]
MEDIIQVRRALDLFLDSRIPEAEAILMPRVKKSMYYSLGYAFILFLKSMMTFQHCDIQSALEAMKETISLADNLRKRDGGWIGNFTSWVKGNSLSDILTMSKVHRHAELVYAEAYLLKALLSIIHDESFVAFIREGFTIRTSYSIYRTLEKYVSFVKTEAEKGEDVTQYDLDDHFSSGVALGIGCFNIMLSLLPTSVLRVVEFIGFSSDRKHGMEMLESIGGWQEYGHMPLDVLPPKQSNDEGLRRQFCDMVLLLYHIILSKLIPLSDVDEQLAQRILAYNLGLYPSGTFFLYFYGRQLSAQGQLTKSEAQYHRAIETQKDWKQLQHMCFWELGLLNILQSKWQASYDTYDTLLRESNWSKSVYTYMKAISLSMLTEIDADAKVKQKEALQDMMHHVTSAKQKIAGKSIPLEKFVSRKARKFIAQDNWLLFPDLEILNAFSVLDFMPADLLESNMKRVTDTAQQLANQHKPSSLNHYDDVCLANYLRAVFARLLLATPGQDSARLQRVHKEALAQVFQHANKIQLDHYIYYFSRYENARMMIINKQFEEAEEQIQMILKASQKGEYNIGAGPHAKNKYSLENSLLFKCHNCITEIQVLAKEHSTNVRDDSSDTSSVYESA